MEQIEITKLEAARRQLEVAIHLVFSDDDMVAIHTLVGAAFRILRDLSEARHRSGSYSGWIRLRDYIIEPGELRTLNDILNEAPNFFKHADRDGDSIFIDRGRLFLHNILMLACATYADLLRDTSSKASRAMEAYGMWFMMVYPGIYDRMLGSVNKWKLDTILQMKEALKEGIDFEDREDQIKLGVFLLELWEGRIKLNAPETKSTAS